MRIPVEDFNLEATLESGQVFGFRKILQGVFEGPLLGTRTKLTQANGAMRVETSNSILSAKFIRSYFDLDRDLEPVYDVLRNDERLQRAYERFKGLRLIRQDAWEALVCFIISQNNNLKRIQGICQRLNEHFCGSRWRFPEARVISNASEFVLRQLGLGYRAPYLLETSRRVAQAPERLVHIWQSDYEEAKRLLLEYPGIGEKVADCVLLYGFQKYDAFPVDTWIERVLRKLYFRNRTIPPKKIRAFGQKRWGTLAGYVQQYLFHAARCGVV